MVSKEFELYRVLLSYNPCEIFDYFQADELHGLSRSACMNASNSEDAAYIAGWCNLSPTDGKPFVFINLSRCTDDVHTTGLVMHELMHLQFALLNKNNPFDEEKMITAAERETYRLLKLIKMTLCTFDSEMSIRPANLENDTF
ncbi:MAG: hypothetical protein RIT43_277 [Bacteroidota bacterium]